MNLADLNDGEIYLFPPNGLDKDRDQPRQDKNWDIPGVAANIIQLKERGKGIKGTGVIKPVVIRLPAGALDSKGNIRPGTRPIIVDGEGRQESANYANEQSPDSIPYLPCVFQDISSEDAFEIAYYANAHASPMAPVDDALALLRIKKRYGIGYDKLAQRTNHTKDYVRQRLKAIGDEDTLPILEARPDTLALVRRINQVEKGEFRDHLIKIALPFSKDNPQGQSASFDDINDSIAANKVGLTLERYRAEKAVQKLEKAYEKEAAAAKSTTPATTETKGKRSGGSTPTTPTTFQPATPLTPPPPSSQGIEVRPYIGDALDTLIRNFQDVKLGLAEATLSDERRADSLVKAYKLKAISLELIGILEPQGVGA